MRQPLKVSMYDTTPSTSVCYIYLQTRYKLRQHTLIRKSLARRVIMRPPRRGTPKRVPLPLQRIQLLIKPGVHSF